MLEEYNTITFSVLLTSNEFSLLGRLLTDYESREIPVEVFARELLKLISDEEKVIIGRIKYRFILALQYNQSLGFFAYHDYDYKQQFQDI